MMLLFCIFPNGHYVPRWTRWLFLVSILISLLFLAIPEARSILPFTILPQFILLMYAQVYRYRNVSSDVERQQTKWVIFGLLTTIVLSVIASIIYGKPSGPLINLIPLSLAIAILRSRLWDIDLILNRTLVYGALTGGIVALYVLLVGALSMLSQASGNLLISLLATGLIAFLFQPLRERLQRGVNRLLYGERDDPYAALARLGKRLEASIAPEAVLPTVVTTVREVLKLPYVGIYLQNSHGNRIVAESASPSLQIEDGRIRVPGMEREGLCMPLIHRGDTLGYIVLGPRAPNEAFGSTDLRLLDDLIPQVGVAVHAARLTADLQRSRERLVLAREEERRRLRRDLHDDLAPTLATLGLTASTAADLIPTKPETAATLVKELQTEIRATVANIRRLVYDLRPPTLDELGLLAAVRERAAQYSNAPDGFHVTVEAPAELPALPAAVEVAAYRIVQEALENVSKHSQARECTIRFANQNRLEIEVTDEGIGLPPNLTPGIGLRSMRERAEELGGSCVIERGANRGTRVLACLPIGEIDGTFARPDRR
jgi:signal transduction histidine kinase